MNALYLLIIIFGVCIQQVVQKEYNKRVVFGAYSFAAASALVAVTIFLATSGGKLDFTPGMLLYSFAFATAYSVSSVFTLLAIKEGSLALTSLIISYSLIIPTFYGLFAFKEDSGILLYIGIALLLVSLVLINIKPGDNAKISLKWLIYVFLAFVGNGGCSTIQKVQQRNTGGLYRSEFMIVALIITVVALFACALLSEKKSIGTNLKKGFWLYIICGIANGIVNFLVLTVKMPASVMFPIISAGGIVVTAILGRTVYKEKMTYIQTVGFILGTLSIVALNL